MQPNPAENPRSQHVTRRDALKTTVAAALASTASVAGLRSYEERNLVAQEAQNAANGRRSRRRNLGRRKLKRRQNST